MRRALSRNGYSYVEGNPITRVDPSGKYWPAVEAALVCLASVGCIVAVAAVAVVAYLAYKATTAAYGLTCTAYPHNPGCGGPIDPVGDLCRVIGRSIEHTLDEMRQRLERLGTDTSTQTQTRTRTDTKEDEKTQRKHIALGLQGILGSVLYLDKFTINLNTWLNPHDIYVYAFAQTHDFSQRPIRVIPGWREAGLTRGNVFSGNLNVTLPEAANNAEAIHFNLEGVNLREYNSYTDWANASQGSFLEGQITASELYTIKQNPSLCRKTFFYENGSAFPPIPSPQLSIAICGSPPALQLPAGSG